MKYQIVERTGNTIVFESESEEKAINKFNFFKERIAIPSPILEIHGTFILQKIEIIETIAN